MAREREELRRQQEQLRYEQEKRNNLKRGREVEHGYLHFNFCQSVVSWWCDYNQNSWTVVGTHKAVVLKHRHFIYYFIYCIYFTFFSF